MKARVEKLVPGGAGLCRDDDGVFFVEGVAAGEYVDVTAPKKMKGARTAKLLAILEPSAERVVADCAVVDKCGGCDWLHLSRAAQTAGKEAIVDDALVRVGKFSVDEVKRFRRPLLVPPDGEKRRRARFVADHNGRLTFSAKRSHDRVVVDACPAVDDRIAALFVKRFAKGATVNVAVDDHGVHVDDDRVVGEVTAGAFAAVSRASSFAQATRFGGAAIRDAVVDAVGTGDGGVAGKRVLELFAGSGHLTLPLLAMGAIVDAVEGDAAAVGFLQQNVGLVSSPAGSRVRRAFIDEGLEFGAVDVVVADPPRTGVPGSAALFARFPASTVLVLVSCDPATGARDLQNAVAAGFVVDQLTPIDAFPRTHHVEWVALLRRR